MSPLLQNIANVSESKPMTSLATNDEVVDDVGYPGKSFKQELDEQSNRSPVHDEPGVDSTKPLGEGVSRGVEGGSQYQPEEVSGELPVLNEETSEQVGPIGGERLLSLLRDGNTESQGPDLEFTKMQKWVRGNQFESAEESPLGVIPASNATESGSEITLGSEDIVTEIRQPELTPYIGSTHVANGLLMEPSVAKTTVSTGFTTMAEPSNLLSPKFILSSLGQNTGSTELAGDEQGLRSVLTPAQLVPVNHLGINTVGSNNLDAASGLMAPAGLQVLDGRTKLMPLHLESMKGMGKQGGIQWAEGLNISEKLSALSNVVEKTDGASEFRPLLQQSVSNYLNMDSSARTQVPVNVRFGHPQWAGAIAERTAMIASQSIQFAELQLDPPELGPLQIKISISQDQASVSFSSANQAVREGVDQSLAKLKELFDEQGLDLVDVDVSDHPSNHESTENDEGELAEDVFEGEDDAGITETTLEVDQGIDFFA